MKVIFYTHQRCKLCEDASVLLQVLQSVYDFTIEERDIYTKDIWLEKYQISVPVIEVAGQQFMYPELSFESIASFIEQQVNHTE